MKKHFDRIPQYVATALAVLVAPYIICAALNFEYDVRGIEFVYTALAVTFAFGAIRLLVYARRGVKLDKNNLIATVAVFPLSIAAWFVFEGTFPQTAFVIPVVTAVFAFTSACLLICSGKLVSGGFYIVICIYLLPIFIISFIISTVLSDFGETLTTSPAVSPDGKYTAQQNVADNGALGIDREAVDISRNINIDMGIVTLTSKPFKSIYVEYKGYDYDIEWLDNDTVIIDGARYNVK
ncbi:MAG: hypothetical protein IJ002_03775 [Clostridia bacterium]|nr:hypothetical protein [Clostridia bacterium]